MDIIGACCQYNMLCCLFDIYKPVSLLVCGEHCRCGIFRSIQLNIFFLLFQKFFEEWVNLGTEKACFMKTITRHSGKYKTVMQNEAGSHLESAFNSCDSYAMATAIDTSVVTEYIRCGVSVELQGLLTRGMMVLDSQNLLGKKNHAFVMKKCDIEKFKRLMMAALL